MVLHHGGVLEMLQHLCCSYPAVAMVNTNMVANRGISSLHTIHISINPSSSSQYFQQKIHGKYDSTP